jgi:hypothetical protein
MKDTRGYQLLRKCEQNLRKNFKRFLLTRRMRKAIPVFIFQMGKVASSSIHYSLKKQYPGAVAHAHHIGPSNWASELFYRWFKAGNEIKIISPVRDPISRNVSSFFQDYSDYSKKEFERLNLDTEKMIDDFINQYQHDVPLTWFDDNIKKYFSIDIYETPFPEQGVAVYRSHNVSLLVFRIDLDDSLKEKAIREFLSFDSFRLQNKNVSSNKEYYEVYKNFIKTIKLPDEYLSKMKRSKYFNYFYTPDEIEKIICRWRG